MSKSIVINLGHGGLKGGFPRVTVQLWSVGHLFPEQFMGSLPAVPEIGELYRDWQTIYLNLCSRFVLLSPLCETRQGSTLEIEESGINNVSVFDSDELCQELQLSINRWFKSPEFLNIDQQLRSRLNVEEEIRVIIEVNEVSLRRLPWHCWDFFEAFPKAEMALSRPEFKRQERLKPNSAKQKVRILAILGNSVGIDLQAETVLLQSIHDAEVIFIVNPEPEAFKKELLNPKSWDILFFAGHSQTEGETGRIYINENHKNNSLTIEELEIALKGAISRGLQLAIFNSCDGVGLGLALEKLHIPTVIVMREPVPNHVAQEFFHHFLQAFAVKRLSLYLAVRQAREKLVDLESEFPAASWLPVICQNPAVQTPSWLALGGMPPCPYRGLFAFQEEDAHLFFGREKFTLQLITAVNTKKLVSVIAPSGSGKSSVVFAGLIPYLRSHATPELPIKIAIFRPGNNPFDALATALSVAFQSSEFNSNPKNVDSGLGRLELGMKSPSNPGHLCNIIENIVKQNNGQRLVLVADQFEELYALISEAKRLVFLQELLKVVNDLPNFRLVITLRADFLGRVLEDECLGKALQQYPPELLIPMNREELREAIIKPALKEGVKLEEGLIERIIDDVNQQPGHLALLQFALTQLWETQRQGILSCTAYQQIGGVEKALAKHAEQVYLRLSSTDRKRMQRIFTQLVQPGEGTADTRRLASRAEVGEENWDLVAYLASARLLVTGRHNKTGTEIVEIVHEELIRGWKELKSWMQQDREFRCWQEKLRSAIRTWESIDKDEDALLRGKTLTDAEDWFNKRLIELSLEERSFIVKSLELQQFQNNNRKRRRQLIISGLSLGLVFSLGLAAQAWWQGQNATRSEIEALNATAEAQLASKQEFNALITTLKVSKKLKKNISNFGFKFQEKVEIHRNINNLLQETVYKVKERNRLEGHIDEVRDAKFSPDGQIIATASRDKTVKLWSFDGKEITTLKGHKDLVHSVSFSRDKEPNKQIIATASWDGTVKLWTVSGKLITTLPHHKAKVYSVSFSPDNQRIATADSLGNVKIWTREGKLIITFKAHNQEVFSISFSPDGKKIATASADSTVKLWDWDGKKLKTLKGHKDWVWSARFSPDGEKVATASRDTTVKLWNIDGKEIKTMNDHQESVTSVSFSPDGKMIATTSADKTVILWSEYGDKLETLTGHQDWVWRVNFSPDGKTIATVSKDKTVKLIQVKGKKLQVIPAHHDAIYGVSFSPDGKEIATASRDGTAKLWSPEGQLITTLKNLGGELNDINFNPNGQTILTTSTNGTITILNRKGKIINSFNGHKKFIWNVSFSPDGQIFATGSEDKTVKLWSQNGKLLKTIPAHDDTVNSVSFSPDGKTLATASWDKKAKLWTLSGKLITTLVGHEDGVRNISFSPDGKTIATCSQDKTVKLWTKQGKFIKNLTGHNDAVFRVRFSPDGKIIATASLDGTVKLWNLYGGELITYPGHDDSVFGIDFSPDGQTLASGDRNGKLILWNLNFNSNQLLAYGCNWVHNYLKNNPNVNKRDKHICDGITTNK
jgi:WD40 repeat protein